MGRFKIVNVADVQGALDLIGAEGVRKLTLRLTPDFPASGQVFSVGTPNNAETITITDGAGTTVIFEFTDGGGLTVGDVEVNKSGTSDNGMSELLTAINGSALTITAATVTGGDTLPLDHDTQGSIGNASVITTTAADLTPTQFAGGLDGNLNGAGASQVIDFPEDIPAGSVVLSANVSVLAVVAGGIVSAGVLDLGDVGDDDKWIAAADVEGSVAELQAPAGAAWGSIAGLPFEPAAVTPQATIALTGGNVEDLDTAEIICTLVIASPPVS